MLHLPQVTLVGIDCLNVERLALALDISSADITFGAVKLLTSLETTDKRKVEISPLLSIDAYSKFCLQDLHQYIDTPYALIVQHDGFVLNVDAWQDTFLEYDYIGAPFYIDDWAKEKHGVPDDALGNLLVGNGGFSLRSSRLMKLIAKLYTEGNFVKNDPEDWAICYTERENLKSHGIKFAPVEIAETFSFEGRTRENYKYVDSFGFHGLKWTDISNWLEQHQKYARLIKNEFRLEELE